MPCMHAGFIESDQSTSKSRNLFYWMYKTNNWNDTDKTTPIAIWLNGGPGASSTFANFLLNGPLRISMNTTVNSETQAEEFAYNVTNAPEGSWADIATMIFVD